MSPNDKLPYSKTIANKVTLGIRNGESVRDIFASIQSYQNAPASYTTFYKLYGEDMAKARADIVGQIGGVVVDKALEGDFKAAELYLRSKGGWSPKETVEGREAGTDEEEEESAINALMKALGKDVNSD